MDSLAAFIARADVSGDIWEFFVLRGIEPAAVPSPDAESPFVDTGPEPEPLPDVDDEKKAATVQQKIASMIIAQRMSLAMKGTREERSLLIRDPNKIVAVAVLSSPKVTEQEVEAIAKMASLSDEILRIIANTRAWSKSYAITLALVKNPKTPLALSMNMLSRLNEKDVRMLSTDRNVPDVLRITARKEIVIDK